MVITSVGRKSGALRKNPLMRVERGGKYLAVASIGGGPTNPEWYYNFLANPVVELQDGPEPASTGPGCSRAPSARTVGLRRADLVDVRQVPAEDRAPDPDLPARRGLTGRSAGWTGRIRPQRGGSRLGPMSLLIRVELPDVPGSLGRLASAIGSAGGDIEALEIVEKRHDGTAVDDVLLETPVGVMPDSDRVGVQRPRRGPGGVDQPLRRGQQPVPGPRGGRGADLQPGDRARTARRHAADHLPLRVGCGSAPATRCCTAPRAP